VMGSREAEIARVAAVRAALGPAIRLRLDANGAWGVDEAIAIIRAVERYGIELVEQPAPVDDLAGLARVRAAVDTPIAADESVGGPEQARQVVEAGAADVLIVKPIPAGGLRRAREVIALAQAAGLRALVTTTIDSGVGVAAALHLAATLPAPPLACGLATGPLLVGDLIAAPLYARAGAARSAWPRRAARRAADRQVWRRVAQSRQRCIIMSRRATKAPFCQHLCSSSLLQARDFMVCLDETDLLWGTEWTRCSKRTVLLR